MKAKDPCEQWIASILKEDLVFWRVRFNYTALKKQPSFMRNQSQGNKMFRDQERTDEHSRLQNASSSPTVRYEE